MKINIGIDDKSRKAIVAILNATLADEIVLYFKTRNFHWNVEGASFSEHHQFFESQYEALDDMMDEVAERARMLDGAAAGSMAEFVKLARIKETVGKPRDGKAMIAELLSDHEAVIRQLRKDIDKIDDDLDADIGTEDFLTGLVQQHEKMAWMLRAYLR